MVVTFTEIVVASPVAMRNDTDTTSVPSSDILQTPACLHVASARVLVGIAFCTVSAPMQVGVSAPGVKTAHSPHAAGALVLPQRSLSPPVTDQSAFRI